MAGSSSLHGKPAVGTPTLVPTGQHAGKGQFALDRPVVLIGSSSNCRLHLVSPTISHHHALIVRSNGGVYIRDLASRSHVLINGQKVHERTLKNGDVVTVGAFSFKFNAGTETGDRPDLATDPIKLHVADVDTAVPVDERVILIGRRPACDITLTEESVSTCHAVILEMNGKRYLRDLGSRSGSYLNDTAVHQSELAPGDEIRIGDTRIQYGLAEAPSLDAEDSAAGVAVDSEMPAVQPEIESPQESIAPVEDELDLTSVVPIETSEIADESELDLSALPESSNKDLVDLAAEESEPAHTSDTVELPASAGIETQAKKPAALSEPSTDDFNAENDLDLSELLADEPAPTEKLSPVPPPVEQQKGRATPPTPAAMPLAEKSVAPDRDESGTPDLSARTGWRSKVSLFGRRPKKVEAAPAVPAIEPAAPLPTPSVAPAPVIPAPIEPAPVAKAPVEEELSLTMPFEELDVPETAEATAADELDVVESESELLRFPQESEFDQDDAIAGDAGAATTVAGDDELTLDQDTLAAAADRLEESSDLDIDFTETIDSDAPVAFLAETENSESAVAELPPEEPSLETLDLSTFPTESPAAEPAVVDEDVVLPLARVDEEPRESQAPTEVESLADDLAITGPAAEVLSAPIAEVPAAPALDVPSATAAPTETSSRRGRRKSATADKTKPEAEKPRRATRKGPRSRKSDDSTEAANVIPSAKVETPEADADGFKPIDLSADIESEATPAAKTPAPTRLVEIETPAIAPQSRVELIEPTEPTLESAQDLSSEIELAPAENDFTEAPSSDLSDSSFGRAVTDLSGGVRSEIVEPEPSAEVAEIVEEATLEESTSIEPVLEAEIERHTVVEPPRALLSEPIVEAPEAIAEEPAAVQFIAPPSKQDVDVIEIAQAPEVEAEAIEEITDEAIDAETALEEEQADSAPDFVSNDKALGTNLENYLGGMPLNLADLPEESETTPDDEVAKLTTPETSSEAADQAEDVAQELDLSDEVPTDETATVASENIAPDEEAVASTDDAVSLDELEEPASAASVTSPMSEVVIDESMLDEPLILETETGEPVEASEELAALDDSPVPEAPVAPPPAPAAADNRAAAKATTPPPAARRSVSDFGKQGQQDLAPVGADESIPPFEGKDPTMGRVTMAFDGLALNSVRQTDVFAQNSQMAPTDPFGGANPNVHPDDIEIPQANANAKAPSKSKASAKSKGASQSSALDAPGQEFWADGKEPSGDGSRSRHGSGAAAWPDQAARDSLRAADPRARRSGRRRIGLPTLAVMMLCFMGASLAAVWFLFSPQVTIKGTLRFANTEVMSAADHIRFEREQQSLLEGPEARSEAATLFIKKTNNVVDPGFLRDPIQFARGLSQPSWPEPNKMVFTYVGNDKTQDRARMAAILEAMYSINHERVGDLTKLRETIDGLVKEQARLQQEFNVLQDQVDNHRMAAAARPTPERLQALTEAVGKTDETWNAALMRVKNLQAELDRVSQSATATNTTQPEAVAQASADPDVAKMQSDVDAMLTQIAALRQQTSQQVDKSRKALDDAIEQFQGDVKTAQSAMEDSPELARFVTSMLSLQEEIGKLTQDFIHRQEEQYASLNKLKRRLDEKMEAHRNKALEGDTQLADWKKQLEMATRQLHAAEGQSLTEEAADRKAAVELLTTMIKSRQEILNYDDVQGELQQYIDDQQKALEEERKRTEGVFAELQEKFKQKSVVEKLPAEQQAMAEQLQKRMEAMSAVRKQYAEAVEAENVKASAELKKLEDQVTIATTQLESRKKELAEAAQKNLSDQQKLARLRELEQTQTELAAALDGEGEAQKAYFSAQRELREAQSTLQAAHAAEESTEELTQAAVAKSSALRLTSETLEDRRKELYAKVEPLPPLDESVSTPDVNDPRWFFVAATWIVIVLVFIGLILFAHLRHVSDGPPMARLANGGGGRDREFDDESLNAKPGDMQDLPHADADEDSEAIAV